MNAPILTLTGLQHAVIDIEPTAIERRDDLVTTAHSIEAITDAMDADAAASVLREIEAHLKGCESARVAIGGPVLNITRKINDTAKVYSEPLKIEKDRLSRILGIYQQAEREKAEKARREAAEAARKIAEEEARKLAAAEIEHGADSPEAEAAAEAAVNRVAEARVAVAQVTPVQPKGVALRQPWKFEVTDIKALAAAHPELVVISPNTAAINAVIKHNQDIPGLRIWQEVKASIR
jgi:chemotaxis protein histidine kinase CheA